MKNMNRRDFIKWCSIGLVGVVAAAVSKYLPGKAARRAVRGPDLACKGMGKKDITHTSNNKGNKVEFGTDGWRLPNIDKLERVNLAWDASFEEYPALEPMSRTRESVPVISCADGVCARCGADWNMIDGCMNECESEYYCPYDGSKLIEKRLGEFYQCQYPFCRTKWSRQFIMNNKKTFGHNSHMEKFYCEICHRRLIRDDIVPTWFGCRFCKDMFGNPKKWNVGVLRFWPNRFQLPKLSPLTVEFTSGIKQDKNGLTYWEGTTQRMIDKITGKNKKKKLSPVKEWPIYEITSKRSKNG